MPKFYPMKKLLLSLITCLIAVSSFAGNQLTEGFEYANHDLETPIGWSCDDNTWLCGYLDKDHNRTPHTGNWYAFTGAEEAWMFMPISFFERLKYRFYCWAVSDGDFELEFWTGSSPDAASMHTQLLGAHVSGGVYEQFYSYVETIPANCQFFGIRALKDEGASFLTIDDIDIDMVSQYDFTSDVITGDTAMYPGTEGIFRFWVKNTGYDPLDITAHPSNEYFSNLSCIVDGTTSFTFHLEPEASVEVTAIGTLRPEIVPEATVWLDIMMTIPCGCNTSMVTFWVTSLDITQASENNVNFSLFPNPTSDFVTIEAEDLQEVTLMDLTGKNLSSTAAEGHSIRLDVSNLKAGVYLISAKTRTTSSLVKSILKM